MVVSGPFSTIKAVVELAKVHGFSMGILPLPFQKELIQCYDLSNRLKENIELALSQKTQKIDLIYCNDQLMLCKASFGKVPLLDSPVRMGLVNRIAQAIKKMIGLKLSGLEFTLESGRNIKTAASGCMVIQHQTGTLASRLIGDDSSLSDGMISLVVSAPLSVVDYLRLIFHVLAQSPFKKRIASTIGLIKSPVIHIKSENKLDVLIDDKKTTQTPLTVSVAQAAVKINIGRSAVAPSSSIEKLSINNLPSGRELVRAKKNVVPFFSYASEERFKELFTSLHNDARINTIYLVLMVLSTLLATLGLYLDSSSIIIGAMLLAPLMTPIVSLGMGVLRSNTQMVRASIAKICLGVTLALL